MWQALAENKWARGLIGYGSLFTSFGTLLCCALPSTLVLLGFGASLAGFLGEYPQLIWLSENKGGVFGLSFFMLGIALVTRRYSESLSCPIDKKDDCGRAKRVSGIILVVTFLINLVGAFYAFILPRLL